ncbi:hypothetical protein [Micromonospora sp. NPDC050695]|uniref:hypothetical protein n=1 Tax=Micromonospora sp. NPDC050695 TaxID=3154938 RepID=UPI00340C1427
MPSGTALPVIGLPPNNPKTEERPCNANSRPITMRNRDRVGPPSRETFMETSMDSDRYLSMVRHEDIEVHKFIAGGKIPGRNMASDCVHGDGRTLDTHALSRAYA